MFAGSRESAQRIAMMYSFFGSCKLNVAVKRGRTLREAQANAGKYPRLQHPKPQRTLTELQKITLPSAKLSLFLMPGIRTTLKGYAEMGWTEFHANIQDINCLYNNFFYNPKNTRNYQKNQLILSHLLYQTLHKLYC